MTGGADSSTLARRDAARFVDFLAGVRADVETALGSLLPAPDAAPARLHEAMRYAVLAGDKRVRPALALAAAEAFGARRRDVVAPAAALEMVHTFSLVHDDLPALDDDDLRRGRPTVHKQFDESTAILVGDALLNLGLETLAREPAGAPAEVRRRSVELVAEALGTAGMIGGQFDDLAAESAWPADPAAMLARIHRLKTGALVVASLRLGGVHAGVDEADDRRLAALGERLGLMFQIADDILDVESSSEVLGKTAGKDAAARKLTYPGLFGLEESHRRLESLHEQALGVAAELPAPELFASLVEFFARRDR